MERFDLIMSAAFSVAWLLAILALLGLLPVRGGFDLDLYRLFSVSGGLGWISGNLYVWRRGHLPKDLRLRVLASYLTGPLAAIFLLRALTAPDLQRAAPLAPVYAVLVFWLFFLVPVTLRQVPRMRDDRD